MVTARWGWPPSWSFSARKKSCLAPLEPIRTGSAPWAVGFFLPTFGMANIQMQQRPILQPVRGLIRGNRPLFTAEKCHRWCRPSESLCVTVRLLICARSARYFSRKPSITARILARSGRFCAVWVQIASASRFGRGRFSFWISGRKRSAVPVFACRLQKAQRWKFICPKCSMTAAIKPGETMAPKGIPIWPTTVRHWRARSMSRAEKGRKRWSRSMSFTASVTSD